MKVSVRGKNKFEPTAAIKQYAIEKLQRLNPYFTKSDEIEANVLCKVYEEYHVVEVTIPAKHVILRVETKAPTMYGAIDIAVDKLELQITKHKTKINSSIKKREGIANFFKDELDVDALEKEILATNLVKNKQVDLSPMTSDEAITQMEVLGHSFYVFLNESNQRVSVVYRREDGDYAIIETK
ncbi:MAG TPA: ribosome-associated translation inhibitor RaiA [Bacilli bacterium]|nr:ribosome-associated translation inhibitor RaiA [Bacilli bacterium]